MPTIPHAHRVFICFDLGKPYIQYSSRFVLMRYVYRNLFTVFGLFLSSIYPTAQVVCEPDVLQWVQAALAGVPLQLQNGDYCEHSEAWWMESCLPHGYGNGRLGNWLNYIYMQCGLMWHIRNILLAWQMSSGVYDIMITVADNIFYLEQFLAEAHTCSWPCCTACTIFTLEPVCWVRLIGEAIGDEKDIGSPHLRSIVLFSIYLLEFHTMFWLTMYLKTNARIVWDVMYCGRNNASYFCDSYNSHKDCDTAAFLSLVSTKEEEPS